MPEFVHLHVHSQYSMLDSSIRLKALVERVKTLGMPAVAVTDHGSMFGAVQLTKYCKEAGIKPILGAEVNVVPGRRDDPAQRHHHHLVLLAKSQEGYQNLVRIVSRGWVEGLVQGVPRVDLELLREHHRGLVALTGCMGGYVAQEVLLRGPRAERAVVHVHASHWCTEELALAPALSSLHRAGSILIFHTQAVRQRRDVLVRYMSVAASVGGATVERADFLSRMHTLGDGQAHLTEKALAGMLRSYSLIFQ